ncbi:GNAT family N-acetyltransferase [Tenacibaculum maritimum]|uniref:GNAT family N-acetyltransferase n=1 Tax=Tenacibaculum maritimum TaxID=107401 RepID=UPI00388EBCDC
MKILSCNNNTPNARYFLSINEIPNDLWEKLQCTNNNYFNPLYLSALEVNNPQISFSYIVLLDIHQNPIAFASIQILDFYLDNVQNKVLSAVEKIKSIGHKLGVISTEKPLKIVTCGNTFVSGEHGVFIKEHENKKEVIKDLARAITNFPNSKKDLKNKVDAYMLKDFIQESLFITDELHGLQYYSFNVEPNMVLYLDEKWNDFHDYLAVLKTKFRVKAKKAFKQSIDLDTKIITEDNIDLFLPKMEELYKKVSTKANFNLNDFNINTYKTLKQNLKEAYILQAYYLQDKMVGFLSGMINQNALDAHFVGIDYELNKTYAIYQRMLYDYIGIAIKNKLSIINFGRTASEIKSSIGAVPQDLTIYLRHKKSIPNRILSLFLKRIQPTEFKQMHPFKSKNS